MAATPTLYDRASMVGTALSNVPQKLMNSGMLIVFYGLLNVGINTVLQMIPQMAGIPGMITSILLSGLVDVTKLTAFESTSMVFGQ
jgi:hypothetical protein